MTPKKENFLRAFGYLRCSYLLLDISFSIEVGCHSFALRDSDFVDEIKSDLSRKEDDFEVS